MQGPDSTQRQLAEHRARLCMLGLGKLQDQWPVAGWVLKLFDRLMEEMRSQNMRPIHTNRQVKKRSAVQEIEPRKRLNHHPIFPNSLEMQPSDAEDEYVQFGPLCTMNNGYEHQDYQDPIPPSNLEQAPTTDFGITGANTFFTLFPEEDHQAAYPLLDEVFAWAI
jgi:hypothetical protein